MIVPENKHAIMVVIKIYDLKMVRGDTSYIYWIFNFLKCTDYMTVSLFNVSIIRCFIKPGYFINKRGFR